MIRIIYEWQVEAHDIDAFRATWQRTTTAIHRSVKGARGSFLLQRQGDPGRILTIARWDSLEDWQAFWQCNNPQAMQSLHALGTLISFAPFDEYADYTV